MALLVFLCGAFFGVLLLLNNLFKTLGRVAKISFLELLLTYLTVITLIVSIILNNLDAFAIDSAPITGELPGGIPFSIPVAPPDPQIEFFTLIAAGVMAAFSLLYIVLEIFRPERLKGSRGVFGLFSAAFIALSTVSIPFFGVYFALDTVENASNSTAVADTPTELPATNTAVPAPTNTPESAAISGSATWTPNAAISPSPQGDELALTPTETPDPESLARIVELFQAIRIVLADEIDLPEGEIFAQLDAGVSLAELVSENGGDVEKVISELTALMREMIMDSAERGEINRLQAALFSSQMGTIIRIAVNSDLNTFGQRFGAATPDPNATRARLTDLLTAFPAEGDNATSTPVALTVERGNVPTLTSFPTNTVIPTETPSPTMTEPPATFTRTPPPTATDTPDRVATLFRELTLTPIGTPIPATVSRSTVEGATGDEVTATRNPRTVFCVASVDYNLRLRAAPSSQAETLLVIPYTTVLELTAQNSDGTWFAAEYDGQTGWLDGEFMTLSASCANLPYR